MGKCTELDYALYVCSYYGDFGYVFWEATAWNSKNL
jgi:hypothetical protein